jgi:HSP20 family molecular chaperone IbpA
MTSAGLDGRSSCGSGASRNGRRRRRAVLWAEGVTELIQDDTPDLADDIRGLFADIDKGLEEPARFRGECRPSLDIVETATAVEVIVDVPGVPTQAIRVLMRRNVLLVVGAKVPADAPRPARFHIAERTYGQFARSVRVDAAVDATRAKATIRRGQLRIVLPRLADRRGVAIAIPVEAAK